MSTERKHMPPLKKQNKSSIQDTRTTEEIAIQSTITSSYNIFTPGYKAQNIRVKNPLTGKDSLFSVKDSAFFELFYYLAQKGLYNKMMLEVETFTAKIDPDWQVVYVALQDYFNQMKQSAENNDL